MQQFLVHFESRNMCGTNVVLFLFSGIKWRAQWLEPASELELIHTAIFYHVIFAAGKKLRFFVPIVLKYEIVEVWTPKQIRQEEESNALPLLIMNTDIQLVLKHICDTQTWFQF